MKLTEKFVFHIPLFRYVDEELLPINNINSIIDELIEKFNENNYKSLYLMNVKGFYKSRCFDEILITMYISSSNENRTPPDELFRKWFKENNDKLKQESFAFEYNDTMFVEDIIESEFNI